MGWGTLIQLAGMGYQAEMDGRANHKAVRSNRRTRQAQEQYDDFAQKDEADLSAYLRDLGERRTQNQGRAGRRIMGRAATEAANRGEAEYDSRLMDTLGGIDPMMAPNGRRAAMPGFMQWRKMAEERNRPRLASQAGLVRLAGRRQGQDDHTQDELDALAEADLDIQRSGQDRGRRSALLGAFREREFAKWARKFGGAAGQIANLRANGAMVSGLAGVAGGALNSYQANQPRSTTGSAYSGGGAGAADIPTTVDDGTGTSDWRMA